MQETKVISTVISSREAFEKVESYVKSESFTEFGRFCWTCIREYYEIDKQADHVDLDLFHERLAAQFPRRKELIARYVDDLPEPGSVDNILKLHRDMQREQLSYDIMAALSSGRESTAQELMNAYLTAPEDEDESKPPILTDYGENFKGENLVPIAPTKLNTALGGGLPRQSQVGIFARTNVGKSTFAVNMCGTCLEAGLRVLYIANEEADAVMVFKLAARVSRTTQREIQRDPSSFQGMDGVFAESWSRLRFASLYPGDLQELRALIKKHEPDVVIIDQVRNMKFARDNLTINLEQAAKSTRALAKEFNVVMVLITQAGESAKDKLVLNVEDIDWSNTGFQAQLDLLIGLGMNDSFRRQDKMMLSFPKWKFGPPIEPFHVYVDYEKQLIKA